MSTNSTEHVVIEMTDIIGDHNNKRSSSGNHNTEPTQRKNNPHFVAFTNSAAKSREERDVEFDEDMLRRAIADTGKWAYGTISVEAWVLNEQTGKLVRPHHAFWFDPVIINAPHAGIDYHALLRLVDENREDFCAPEDLAPGIGLAGALFMELSTLSLLDSVLPHSKPQRVVWREVVPLTEDPDQPFNLRLKLAAQAGIGLAAGVRFHFRGTQGLVLYMARGTTDINKLKSETNEQYLLSATDVIGSIVCLRNPRRDCLAERRQAREATRRRLRNKMLAVIRLGDEDIPSSNISSSMDSRRSAYSLASFQKKTLSIKKRIIMAARKWKGANNDPPPPFSNVEALWTFAGCFLTILMLLYFSDFINEQNSQYSLVLGPFGALVTLQYSLTSAPASQPRNVILGQAISISIALCMTYTRLEANMRRSLGTALCVSLMARLGVTHPPAGAAALIFTGGGYTWVHMGIMLAGNVLAIISAAGINNFNVKRQYPTSWGFGYWIKYVCPRKGSKKGD
mmetsp:Transcript_2105/g.4612  ORF Transcript_2105/g.4612 Transcript_2105/m.4612 type:complete len:511 (-) Transcript_2105:97-1629(-)